ncbi:MAG: hypothetical protein EPN89_03650 [Methylovulum sp.]|nr:MAG: hypothetical protein EPN89_03650 [Methylovulum sp.]
MKHSFFLVIPKQQPNSQRLKEFEAKILEQWITELPTANPLLATRLFYDYMNDFNAIKMPAQLRLDALELLRPSFLVIEEFLRARLLRSGFPKEESDKKTLALLTSLEKQFTLSYWITLKELTGHEISWFQGKNAALSCQRCIKGLSGIVTSYFMMGMPVPDWIWMDLHSLYKLSVKIKKNITQVAVNDSNRSNKTSSPEECYLQIILLSLADSAGLMQKEIRLVYDFIETVRSLVSLKKEAVFGQAVQCLIFTDEDKPPHFQLEAEVDTDSAKLYLDFTRLYQAIEQKKNRVSEAEARFSTMHASQNPAEKLSLELLDYLKQRWSGIPLQSAPLFSDRLDRYLAIGLTSTYKLQKAIATSLEDHPEFLVQSVSSRLLSCVFKKPGILSVGSLVSFRRIDMPEHKRFLGIVDMLVVEKEEGRITFGVQLLTHQAVAVTYLPLNATTKDLPKQALFYKTIEQDGDSYIITDTFILKEDDVVRLFINQEDFPIVLKNKKNIGLGYWQFECMKVAEKRK